MEIGTKVFDGEIADMDSFVPKDLSRRMIFSKKSAVFDLLGKFVPILVGMSLDLREVCQVTKGWDDPVTEEVRSK